MYAWWGNLLGKAWRHKPDGAPRTLRFRRRLSRPYMPPDPDDDQTYRCFDRQRPRSLSPPAELNRVCRPLNHAQRSRCRFWPRLPCLPTSTDMSCVAPLNHPTDSLTRGANKRAPCGSRSAAGVPGDGGA